MGDNVQTVHFGGKPFRELEELTEELYAVVLKFDGRVPILGAVGALRLVEHMIWENQS